jgi:hypothetical protein
MIMDTKLENKPENKPFKGKTKSLDEFAVALALGAEVTGVQRVDDDKFLTFHLQSTFDIEQAWLSLASKTLTVNAADFCEAYRRAKAITHTR